MRLITVILLASVITLAQSPPSADLTFEVASIKRTPSDATGFSYGDQPGGRWAMHNASIATLIRSAYPSQVPELVGAPGWVNSERYEIHAKANGEPSRDEMALMLRALLADRMKLTVHCETQEWPVFALVVARDGWMRERGLC